MEKVIKKISTKILSVLLAFLMIASPLATIVADLDFGWLVGASGDDSGDVIHQNTSYSNTKFSVATEIAIVGSGVVSDKREIFATTLAKDLRNISGDTVKTGYYANLGSIPASANLVVYLCGTAEAVEGSTHVDTFAEKLQAEVESLKKQGKDVLLVTPGPVVAYGDGMIYDTDNGASNVFKPGTVATGANVYNAVNKYVDAINYIAKECNVFVLSIQGKASLFGIDKYMAGTTDGIYPADYTVMDFWIADFIAENYVIAGTNSLIAETTLSADKDEYIAEFDKVYSDFDAVVITVPEGKQIPANITVQTTKHVDDQWFQAIARTKQDADTTSKVSVSLVFDASTARYVRVAGDTALPAGTTLAFYKTRLAAPTITNPIEGQSLSTKQAFNIEWSAVANADRYIVTLKKADGTVVKEVVTGSDVQAFPKGIIEDGESYTVTVESVGSGYFGTGADIHGSVSQAVSFTASKNAPLIDNSESVEEDVSAGKLITVGEVTNLAVGKNFTINDTGFITRPENKSLTALTDNVYAVSVPTTETSEYVVFTDYEITDGNNTAILTVDLGAVYQLYSVSFDTAFTSAVSSANAAPEKVQMGYSKDGATYTYSDMYAANSTRTIKNGDVTVPMTKYLRASDVSARYVQIKLELSQANVYRNLFLDEIVVTGFKKETGVIVRDGSYYFNKHLVGAYRYDGSYTAGEWENGVEFTAIAPSVSNHPVELIIDLNEDYDNNAVNSGDRLVTSLDIGYALDSSAYRPSSITVAVQKEGETTWTTVGGKVYTDVPVVPSFVDEKIALTNADATDIYASKVKVTLYTDEFISSVPADYDSTGFWGKWFALSYIKLVGGQYIGAIEPDGATAAYHANFLQNTDLKGRTDFGDVNANEIWNSISWKSAGYKVANSGYSDAVGNITVGKVYWASEKSESAANAPATDANTQTPSAVNPNYDSNQTAKVGNWNLAKDKKYKTSPTTYTGAAYSESGGGASSSYHTGYLTDGTVTTMRPAQSSTSNTGGWLGWIDGTSRSTITVTVDLGAVYRISSISIDLAWKSGTTQLKPTTLNAYYSTTDGSFISAGSMVDNYTTYNLTNSGSTTAHAQYDGHKHSVTGLNVLARYIKIEYAQTSTSHTRTWMSEIQVQGQGAEYHGYCDSPSSPAYTNAAQTATATANNYGTGNYVGISGWILHTYGVSKVEYSLDGGGWKALNVSTRSDVQTSVTGWPEYTNCGYHGDVSTDGLTAGAHTIKLRMTTRLGSTTVQFLTINVTVNDTTPQGPQGDYTNVSATNIISNGKNYAYNQLTYTGNTVYCDPDTPAAGVYHTGYLTDGKSLNWGPGNSNGLGGWLGWFSDGSQGPTGLEITVDLGGYYDVNGVSAILAWGATNPIAPAKLDVSYSPDGVTWMGSNSILNNTTTADLWIYDAAGNYEKAQNYSKVTHKSATEISKVRYVKLTATSQTDNTKTRLYIGEITVTGKEYVPAGTGEIRNLAPGGTYKYEVMLPGDGLNLQVGDGIAMPEDYITPNYTTATKNSTIAQGGTGHRNNTGVYWKGKLNDGVFANYAAGVTPYKWVGWKQTADTPADGMTIQFDLGAAYTLEDVYFYNSARGNQAKAWSSHTVSYYFSADGSTWSSKVDGVWGDSGTLPQSSTNSTAHPRKRNSATAPSGQYRYVKIVIDNNTGSYTDTVFMLDEVVINGFAGEETGPDKTEKNWALHTNGGKYKGTAGNIDASYPEVYTTGSVWDDWHSGLLNNDKTDVYLANTRPHNAPVTMAYKLSNRIDITSIKIYGNQYLSTYPTNIEIKVGDGKTEAEALNNVTDFATYNPSAPGSAFTYTISGSATGNYVFISFTAGGWVTYLREIQIWGVKSAKLDNPIITSHVDEQEIGIETTLDWEDVVASEDGVAINYDVRITDSKGNYTEINGLTASQALLNNTYFTLGEGFYTITVTSNSSGWESGSTDLVVYYAPKYIITFYAANGAILKSAGQTGQQLSFGVYLGATWDADEVVSAVASVSALPYTATDGTVYYFSHWIDGDGNKNVPTSGEITGNVNFIAQYSTEDVNGTTNEQNDRLTDGVVFNGAGTASDYYFTFNNDTQAYDYVIIDLGDIYYSLSEFDVSFYQKGNELPSQITFEVSSKVYVPSISQGIAFTDSDWNFVSLVQREDFIMDEGTNRWHFNDETKIASVIDGAFGRYIRVKFYYDSMNCGGVYVDEIIASGDDNHDRMNIADGNNIFVDGTMHRELTDGVENLPGAPSTEYTGKEFLVELVETKTGIHSFQFAGGADQTVEVYISAGGDEFVYVETLTGKDGYYYLSNKVSARRIKFISTTDITTSEARVFGDAGQEGFYEISGGTAEIILKSGSISMSNVVSLDADEVTLSSTNNDGTVTDANGAKGLGTGFAMTDGFDAGYANGVSFVETTKGLLWYGLHSSKKGINNYINATFVTAWEPTLDSTAVDFTIGNKTYKFEFNGNGDKGFVVLASDSAIPFDYSAIRTETEWIVEFIVAFAEVTGSNVESAVKYTVTAYEAGASVGTTDAKTYNVDGTTTGWDYSADASSWTTISGYTGDIVATMRLDKVYYGINMFAISVLDAPDRGYAAPDTIRFQTSLDAITWTDTGYAAKEALGDYRYYEQNQPGRAFVYNFSANFEGTTAKYVRALMTVDDSSKAVAIQEFYVNALDEPLKASGGDGETSSFDYKMLWDENNLYIALQYEEDEVPFYTATHEYYETYAMTYDTAKWNQTGTEAGFQKNPDTGNAYTNAFSKSNLMYDKETGFFQLDHTIARLNDPEVATDAATGYPTVSLDNFKLYKVGSISWNKGMSTTGGHFTYGSASLATSIATSVAKVGTNGAGKQTLAADSTLNGYILVSDGYALSQDINGRSLTAVPITIDGNTIQANQINNEIVWFFESDEDTDMSAYSKTLGNYMIYGFRYGTNSSEFYDNFYFDDVSGMMYSKYYLTRAYQGMLWENVYTFPRTTQNENTIFNTTVGGVANVTIEDSTKAVDARRYHFAGDINWNVVKGANGQWNFSLFGQGIESYDNMLDDIDGASSFRLYMSVANLNDTARFDYGNYDFVLDTYVIDDSHIVLKDGGVLPLDATLDEKYLTDKIREDLDTGWNGYKNVEFKSTALGMTSETKDYQLDVSKIKGRAKMSQSENGQSLMTLEIAIPFTQLGFTMDKTGTTVNKWGNYYTKMGVEKPLGKRTLMQFDAKHGYTQDNNQVGAFNNVDEFYYYVDASEFGYILQMAPEGKGYQDMSYTDGEGYATISSVRGEVLNTENGEAIEYNPATFNISKIHTTNADPAFATMVNDLKSRDAFKYVEEDGMYYFTSQLDTGRVINQGGDMSTTVMIPAGGAYFSFDWRVQSETSDTLSVWVEQTDTWNAQYADWIGTYNCGIPYKRYNSNGTESQAVWTGIIDYFDTNALTTYSEALGKGATSFQSNNVELKNDACVGFISGYADTTRNPEEFILASWKEGNRSSSTAQWTVNIGDVLVFSPLVSGGLSVDNGMFRHVWDWNNVTIWIPNTTDDAISYTISWMYWKNGSQLNSYNASDGRGTDDAQITNFRLSTTDQLGYWKNSENWDTLRLDANVADPAETSLGIKELAKTQSVKAPAISASANLINDSANNTFGLDSFFTLSYAAIAQEKVIGTTTATTNYIETKNKISISAANVPAAEIENYKNNAIVFTQEYNEVIATTPLLDWTILELKYNNTYNTWTLNRMFSEGVDKSKFNIYPDDSTIIIAVNYTYDGTVTSAYGETREAVLFGYGNREVLSLLTPEIRYEQKGNKIIETLADEKEGGATQFFTSNIFIRENYNIARGKMYSLRHYPTYSDTSYMYTENWFRENNTEDALAAFLAVYAETPLYYVNESGEIIGADGKPLANTDGDYSKAFVYEYSSGKKLRFDTNQYSDLLYVPAGVGQLTDGDKLSVYSDAYLVEALEDYAIGYFVEDTMGTPSAETVEGIYSNDLQYSYVQTPDAKHDKYVVAEDINTREENIILDLGTVEYGLSAFTARFAGGGEDGVVFPTSVEFAISSDGLSYYYIGSVALDDTGYNSTIFDNAYASIIYTGATDTVYGNTLADYTFDLQTVGVTARYIKATIMNHSAENAKMFITEFTAVQNSIVPDELPKTHASTWIDVSDDASLMYKETLEKWDRVYGNEYSFALAPTQAGYLFAEDEGFPDDGRDNNTPGVFAVGQLTDGIGGAALSRENATAPTLDEMKANSVGWMKAYAAEVSLTFKLDSDMTNVGFISVYALESKDSVDKINQPFNVTAYVRKSTEENSEWKKVATVNANDNDQSEVALKGMDCVLETDEYYIYKYTLAFARDGELAQQLEDFDEAMVVAETDGGEDGWICLTEVEVYEGHPCYPVYDVTEDKYRKTAINLTSDEIEAQESEVRPTFFRGFYDSDKYYNEIQSFGAYNGHESSEAYDKTMVFNNNDGEKYTLDYVDADVEQRALDGRGIPYFYDGDQLLLRVTTTELDAGEYNVNGDWVSTYKLRADSQIFYNDGATTTKLHPTTAVPTPLTVCNVLARDKVTGELPANYAGSDNYYYLPIYMYNSLDYLKNVGYGVDTGDNAARFLNMPANKVEITGTIEWDTNTESELEQYINDKNGISLNLAPMGAKTNTDEIIYNGNTYGANSTLRFGSIWYIDDAAYYNTHTHRKQYGTVIVTMQNLARYLTDTLNAKYGSAYTNYGIQLTKLEDTVELTGIEEVKSGLEPITKLTGVTEVKKLTNVAQIYQTDKAENALFTTSDGKHWTSDNANIKAISFTRVINGVTTYWGSDENIDATKEGRVWTTPIGDTGNYDYWYCSNKNISSYKFITTTSNGVQYWYCNENVNAVSWIGNDENGVESFWYCEDINQSNFENVRYNVLADGSVAYYINPAKTNSVLTNDEDDFNIVTKEGNTIHYWTSDRTDVSSWTYTTIEGDEIHYWYAPNFTGIAGTIINKDGETYATATVLAYNDVVSTRDNAGEAKMRYWTAKSAAGFQLLTDLKANFTMDATGNPVFDETETMEGLKIFLDYVNKYSDGQMATAGSPLSFGGLGSDVRANKYYYYSNISTYLVPENYDDAVGDIFGSYDKGNEEGKYNQTTLLGINNYDQRYLEFDAILAGIPEKQQSAKVVAVPYAIYANNYEFLEFGEVLGNGDAYVEDTWHNIFTQYYGNGYEENNMRYFVYGYGIARSVKDLITESAN